MHNLQRLAFTAIVSQFVARAIVSPQTLHKFPYEYGLSTTPLPVTFPWRSP